LNLLEELLEPLPRLVIVAAQPFGYRPQCTANNKNKKNVKSINSQKRMERKTYLLHQRDIHNLFSKAL